MTATQLAPVAPSQPATYFDLALRCAALHPELAARADRAAALAGSGYVEIAQPWAMANPALPHRSATALAYVTSQTNIRTRYTISRDRNGNLCCTCRDAAAPHIKEVGRACKHVIAYLMESA